MKKEAISQKATDILNQDLTHLRDELRDLRFRVSQNQHKSVRDIRKVKQKIARALTELHKRGSKS